MSLDTTRQGQARGQNSEAPDDLAGILSRELLELEGAERAVLQELGYRDDVDVYDRLHDRARAGSLTHKQQRAWHAMLVVNLIHQLRGRVANGDATIAAHYALRIGRMAGGVLVRARDGARRELARSAGGKVRVTQKRAHWAKWQAIADKLSRRDESRLWAAMQVLNELDRRKVRPLPKPGTIRKHITYPKKLSRS